MHSLKVKTSLIFAAPVPFQGLKQRHQAFAELLSESDYNLIYLNPIKSNGLSLKLNPITKSLAEVTIKVPLRAANHPWLQKFINKIVFKLLQRRFDFKINEAVLWLADPILASLAAKPWKRIFYDRCDLHGAFPGQRSGAWREYEDLLIREADLVFISHPYLGETLPSHIQGKVVQISNAASELEVNSVRQESEHKLRLKLISSGAHFEWVDSQWLQTFANLKEFELHIAGPGRGKEFSQLIRMPNVNYHGTIKHTDLQNLLQEMDVGLIPFKDIELIKGVDPIKAYEFATAKLAIWAPDISSLASNTMISNRFSTGLEAQKFISKNGISTIAKSVTNKKVPTWNDRMETILDRISGLDTK